MIDNVVVISSRREIFLNDISTEAGAYSGQSLLNDSQFLPAYVRPEDNEVSSKGLTLLDEWRDRA
jgi:hypothetical protein